MNPNEDTEFNDALRAHGILPPKPPSRSPSPDIPHITHSDALHAIAATADPTQLNTLLEADNLDSDDERVFEDYRRRRMAEMKKEERKGRYGSVEPLSREDFVREVTEGSKQRLDGEGAESEDEGVGSDEEEDNRPRRLKGTGVVVFLYKDSVPLSQHLGPLLQTLASAHRSTKFLSIPAGMCIPNYPDKNVPTLLVYRNGDMTGNIVAGMGMNGLKTTVKDLEMLLIRYRALTSPSPALTFRGGSDDADEDQEQDVAMVNSVAGGIRNGGGLGTGVGRGTKDDSDESDFDM